MGRLKEHKAPMQAVRAFLSVLVGTIRYGHTTVERRIVGVKSPYYDDEDFGRSSEWYG